MIKETAFRPGSRKTAAYLWLKMLSPCSGYSPVRSRETWVRDEREKERVIFPSGTKTKARSHTSNCFQSTSIQLRVAEMPREHAPARTRTNHKYEL